MRDGRRVGLPKYKHGNATMVTRPGGIVHQPPEAEAAKSSGGARHTGDAARSTLAEDSADGMMLLEVSRGGQP